MYCILLFDSSGCCWDWSEGGGKILGNRPHYKGFWKSAERRLDLLGKIIFQNVIRPNICPRNNPIPKGHFYFIYNTKKMNAHMKLYNENLSRAKSITCLSSLPFLLSQIVAANGKFCNPFGKIENTDVIMIHSS